MTESPAPGPPLEPAPRLTEVHLLGLPLRVRARLSRHVEGLLREFALIEISEQQGSGASLPQRLLDLATELETTYAPYRAQRARAMEDALAAGEEFHDATYLASPQSADYVRHLQDVLEEADDFCRAEQHLLTLPAGEELAAFRRWLFGEILRQLAGEEPRPWPGSRRRDESAADPRTDPTTDPAAAADAPADGGADEAAGELVGEPLVLDPSAGAVVAARRHVRRVLRELDAEDLEDAAELSVSELVTNAVLHARTAFTVTVRTTAAGRIRIEVTDSSPVPVQLRRLGATATTGRGLQMVAATSSAWGTRPLPDGRGPGKTVWFEPQASAVDLGFDAEAWAGDIAELR